MSKVKYLVMAGLSLAAVVVGLTTYPTTTNPSGRVHAEQVGQHPATLEFLNLAGERARQISQERDLYASVMLAQAILESDSGRSVLSIGPSYNLFGIKGKYNGNSVTMKTWEDDGTGKPYYINADFRAYTSWAASMYDYAALLNTDFYARVRRSNAPTYQDATAALTGTYATDTAYGTKLNAIITQYNLTAYDSVPGQVATGDQVWNTYRGQYTSSQTLADDQSWAQYLQSRGGR